MPSCRSCPCLLCATEGELRNTLRRTEPELVHGLFPAYPLLSRFSSVAALLHHLRTAPADEFSDHLLGEILAARKVQPAWIEGLLVLVFLPMLHATIRRVTSVQFALAADDVTQQVLSFFLQVLSSADLSRRDSHFAFAISRSLKRKTFEWAHRQSVIENLELDRNCEGHVLSPEKLERDTALRHFLSLAIARHKLSDEELDLLIEFKLEGNGGADFEASGRGNSNMLRQRLKRLLAKLRRLAAPPFATNGDKPIET